MSSQNLNVPALIYCKFFSISEILFLLSDSTETLFQSKDSFSNNIFFVSTYR